jgi:hypothetical protein
MTVVSAAPMADDAARDSAPPLLFSPIIDEFSPRR